MSLPQRLPYDQMQVKWASELDPVLRNQLIQGILISDITMVAGTNVINHRLGRKQVGYIITDQNAQASIYRSAALNNLTLTLTSDNPCVISLWCF